MRRGGWGGAHTLPPSYLQCLHLTPNIMLLRQTWHVCDSHDLVENLGGREERLKEGAGPGGAATPSTHLCVTARPMSLRGVWGELLWASAEETRVRR